VTEAQSLVWWVLQ